MDAYANALMIAIPSFIILMIIEGIFDAYKGKKRLNAFDTISSLSSGVTNLIKGSLGLIIILVAYPTLVNHLAVMALPNNWVVYAVGFVAIDFAGYWNHRLNHSVNFFWNTHRIHHSSEEFNLPCALRQTISNFINVGVLFLIPAAIMGVPPEVINVIAPTHLFLQFWYHTQYIPKLGWLEYIIITPSQHRVHHAINPIYIDKNLGEIFSIWDRLFGTFQEELEEEPPVYGVTMPAATWNPVKINFQHLWVLIQDAWRAERWWDKLRIWFMPTGWRPADVKANYPVRKIDDIYAFEKYKTPASKVLIAWSWLHYFVTLLLTLFMFSQLGKLPYNHILLYAGILFLSVYGYTSLMDREKAAIWFELAKSLVAISVILTTGDWFGMNATLANGSAWVLFYFILAPLGAYYFVKNEFILIPV